MPEPAPRRPRARDRRDLYREQLEHYRARPEAAAALLKTGRAKANTEVGLPETAAAAVLAQALMNHDECVVRGR